MKVHSLQQMLVLPLILLLATTLAGCGSATVHEPVAGDWISVYFTAPAYPDDPAQRDDGLDWYLVSLVGQAQETVDVAAYDFDLESVTDALLAAQGRGVQVRMVTDGSNADEAALARLRQAGIPVVVRPEGRWGIMHDKFIVVDDTWVWTGSWNLTGSETYRNNNNAVLIASYNLAEDYHVEFEEMFNGQFGASSPVNTPHRLIHIGGQATDVRVEVYFAPEDGVSERLVRLLSSARSSIRFLAFQFTSERLAEALIEQAGRGVTVEGVVESRSANDDASQVERLRAGGVTVRLDGNPYTMHHKVFIVDEQIVVLGSYNFTVSADAENDENLLIIHDPQVAAAFLAEYERVVAQAEGR